MTASTIDTITLFTKTPCVQCGALKRAFKSSGVADRFHINVQDLSQASPEELDRVRSMGLMQAPAVLGPTGNWTGYRPDKVEELVAYADEHGLPDRYAEENALAMAR